MKFDERSLGFIEGMGWVAVGGFGVHAFCMTFNSSNTSEFVLTLFQSAPASKRSHMVREHCPSTTGNTLACTWDRLSIFLMYLEYWSLYCSLSTHDSSFIPGASTGADGGVIMAKTKSTMARQKSPPPSMVQDTCSAISFVVLENKSLLLLGSPTS
jgi:hypothetical protein